MRLTTTGFGGRGPEKTPKSLTTRCRSCFVFRNLMMESMFWGSLLSTFSTFTLLYDSSGTRRGLKPLNTLSHRSVCSYQQTYIAIEFIVCLFICYFTTVIILAKYQLLKHLNYIFGLQILVLLLGPPPTIFWDKSRLFLFFSPNKVTLSHQLLPSQSIFCIGYSCVK